MNPFMLQMMMNPMMGMGFLPAGCCCGVNMPYYGMNDNLTFMNFPVFRNTSMDYLLDPRLAMMQAQQQWQFGGSSIFGSSYLPLFNNFPGIGGGMNMSPWWQPTATKPETEEDKKKREAKEADAKKPEAKKAAALKKTFDNIKKLAEDKDNKLSKLSESIISKAEEAMKKETAEEQYNAMKEVIAAIPEDMLRKAILADEGIKNLLIKAGYNFNYKNNAYALPDAGIIDDLNTVHDNIISKTDYSAFDLLAENTYKGTTPILAAISAWNNTQNEKGILNFLASNIPSDSTHLHSISLIIPKLVNSLLNKADEDYSGCPKIKALRDNVSKLKDKVMADFESDDKAKKYLSSDLKALSKAFENLYACLRMQEAVKVRNEIKSKEEFTWLNEAKGGVITDDMIVSETYECLTKEGISNVPKENELDKVSTPAQITIDENGVVDVDTKYADNPQGLLDEYLVGEQGVLEKIGNSNVYKTKSYDDKNGGVKYYMVKDKKVVEATKKSDGTFEPKNSTAVKSEDIIKYDEALNKIIELLDDNTIEPVKMSLVSAKMPYPVFKANGKNEYYALIGNTFGKIKNCTGLQEHNSTIMAKGTNKALNHLKASDLDTDIKSKTEVETAKKEREDQENKQVVDNIEESTFTCLSDVKDKAKELGISATPLDEYFVKIKNGKKHYFKYENDKLVYKPNIADINKNGQIYDREKKTWVAPESSLQPADLGVKLRRLLNGDTSQEDYNEIDKIMNIFAGYTESEDIVTFIEEYTKQMEKDENWMSKWNDRLCAQISSENDYGEERKTKALQIIAKQMMRLMEQYKGKLNAYGSTSEEYEDMKFYAEKTNSDSKSWRKDGNRFLGMNWFGKGWSFWNSSRTGAANHMDDIIDKFISDYNEKVRNTEGGNLNTET